MDTLRKTWIRDHRFDGNRSGEGAAVELTDGRIMLVFTTFIGNEDHSVGRLYRCYSSDAGKSWSEPELFMLPPEGALNLMSISLLRLMDGRIGMVYCLKWTSTDHCVPYWMASSDDGKSWSEPKAICDEKVYIVVNNDRLVQIRDGTLLLPYALHGDWSRKPPLDWSIESPHNAYCGLFVSRDAGQTWERPDHAQRYEQRFFQEPRPFRPEKAAEEPLTIIRHRYNVFQEPGVVELADGRLMLWIRSIWSIHAAFTDHPDGQWSDFRPLCGPDGPLNVSLGPQTIKRLPGSNRLVMLYNDRGDLGYGEPAQGHRTPLSVASSDDNGESWRALESLETNTERSYCYFSLLFLKETFLVSYYVSTYRFAKDGTPLKDLFGLPLRSNLASLRTCAGPLEWFSSPR